jgi:inorganic pyrophosphatase
MSKVNKEEIKNAIEDLPDTSLDKLLLFIEHLKEQKNEKRPIKSYSLKGKYDLLDIRSEAYE